jgi:hypothetical protein
MGKGETNQSEIARILHVDRSIICRDVAYLRQQVKENIARYVDERLPEEYEKCLVGLNNILKEAWTMTQTDDSIKSDKIKALALAKECYAMKLESTNATVVNDAIRFVASHVVSTIAEKANSDERVTVDKEVSNNDDIQGSEEDRNHEQQSTATTTINSTF